MNVTIDTIIGPLQIIAACDEQQMLKIVQRVLQTVRAVDRDTMNQIPSLFTAIA